MGGEVLMAEKEVFSRTLAFIWRAGSYMVFFLFVTLINCLLTLRTSQVKGPCVSFRKAKCITDHNITNAYISSIPRTALYFHELGFMVNMNSIHTYWRMTRDGFKLQVCLKTLAEAAHCMGIGLQPSAKGVRHTPCCQLSAHLPPGDMKQAKILTLRAHSSRP